MIKKLISEFVGTMLLVFFGCGTAVICNTYVTKVSNYPLAFTILPIALAFGLILMALCYTIGKVSGSHVNPAVSIAMLINGRMDVIECIEYIFVQILGALCGAGILSYIMGTTASLGANGYDMQSALSGITTLPVAFIVEIILTFIFVMVVLSTTAKDENNNAGLVIGLTLTLVHILGIPFTGTSVNPARSLGPAILTGGTAFNQVWVFVLAPIIGAVLAALFYKYIINEETTKTSKK